MRALVPTGRAISSMVGRRTASMKIFEGVFQNCFERVKLRGTTWAVHPVPDDSWIPSETPDGGDHDTDIP